LRRSIQSQAWGAIAWPFEHFRKSLAPRDGELDLDPNGSAAAAERIVERHVVGERYGFGEKEAHTNALLLQIQKQGGPLGTPL